MATVEVGKYGGFEIDWEGVKGIASRQDPTSPLVERQREVARKAISVPFVGVTTNGKLRPDLFPIRQTGVSTRLIRDAAEAYLATLTPEQRQTATLPIDSAMWRSWVNTTSIAMRHGWELDKLTPQQREAALEVCRASLSARGFETMRTSMMFNAVLDEIAGGSPALGEWRYWLCIFGTPSLDEPWGWQMDGHHVNVSFFVLGDQVVLSPALLGAEPNYADRGRYEGLRAFVDEEASGLGLIRALTPSQREKAIVYKSILCADLPRELWETGDGRQQGGAYHDNAVVPYAGVCADELSAGQRELLMNVIETYFGRMDNGHAALKMDEVRAHLDETHFEWIGKYGDDDPFFYRVHSPVVLIEFDHHRGAFLSNRESQKFHIHTIMRTPNGNDYGRDLLRQHYARSHHGERPVFAIP